MLGTWRTNDAEKNHIHKIGKRKKKKEKRNPTIDGIGLENGMAFCVGRESTRRKEGITIRYEGSASESEWHE